VITVRGSALPEWDCTLTNSLIDDKDNQSVVFDGAVHVCGELDVAFASKLLAMTFSVLTVKINDKFVHHLAEYSMHHNATLMLMT